MTMDDKEIDKTLRDFDERLAMARQDIKALTKRLNDTDTHLDAIDDIIKAAITFSENALTHWAHILSPRSTGSLRPATTRSLRHPGEGIGNDRQKADGGFHDAGPGHQGL